MKKMPLLTLLIPIVSLLFNKSNPLLPILVEKNITLDSYMGLWHQVGTSESTTLFGTGPKFTKVSAFYNVIKSQPNTTNISVFNFGFDTHGSFTEIHGFSYSEPNELPTKRKVKFDGLFFEGSNTIT